jgi:hypothetical protein
VRPVRDLRTGVSVRVAVAAPLSAMRRC